MLKTPAAKEIRTISIQHVPACCFALFVFAGYYKAADSLRFIPIDLTLLFWVASGLFCAAALWQQRRLPPGSLVLLGVFLLMAVGLRWPQELAGYASQKELRLFSLTALAAFGPLILLQSKSDRRVFIYVAALLGIVMAALAVAGIGASKGDGRIGVFNTNPILLARASGFAVIVLFLLYWQRRIKLVVFLVLVGMTIQALLISGTRGPVVALLVTLAGMLALHLRSAPEKLWDRGTLLAGGGALGLAVAYLGWNYARVADRFTRLLSGEWRGTEISRWAVWEEASDLMIDSPLGIGWGRMTEWLTVYNDLHILRHPHNIFLEIALEAGWPAAIGFLLLVAWVLVIGLRGAAATLAADGGSTSFDRMLLFAAPLYWLLAAQLSGDVNDNRPLWAVLGMVLAARGARRSGPDADGAGKPAA